MTRSKYKCKLYSVLLFIFIVKIVHANLLWYHYKPKTILIWVLLAAVSQNSVCSPFKRNDVQICRAQMHFTAQISPLVWKVLRDTFCAMANENKFKFKSVICKCFPNQDSKLVSYNNPHVTSVGYYNWRQMWSIVTQ